MKPLLIAALALICPFGTSVKATQVPPSGAGIPFWSPVGPWVVLLLPVEKGGYTCAALTRSPPAGPAGYSMGFALSASTTHFYLNYSPPPRSAPTVLTLAVDGKPIAQLKIFVHGQIDSDGEELLVADLPGEMLARQVFPAMMAGQMLSAIAGEGSYAVPILHFDHVVRDLRQCAKTIAKWPQIS